MTANESNLHVYIHHGTKKMSGAKHFLPQHDGDDVIMYTFSAGGKIQGKVCPLLWSMQQTSRLCFGTLAIKNEPVIDIQFKEACEFVKSFQFDEWNDYMGQAKLDKSRDRATARQETLLLVRSELQRFLEHTWKANTKIRKFDPTNTQFLSFKKWPNKLKNTIGARWNDSLKDYDLMTLYALLTSSLMIEAPLFLVGLPDTHKSYMAENIASVLCIQTALYQYLQSGNLDDWGVLSGNGSVDASACSIMDDCPTLTANARPLATTELLQLLIVRAVSSYGARYHPATFPAQHTKILTCNVDITKSADLHDLHSFPRTCPWLIQSAKACNPSMRQDAIYHMSTYASTVECAQARRPFVFYFGTSPYGEPEKDIMRAADKSVMDERLARMQAFFEAGA